MSGHGDDVDNGGNARGGHGSNGVSSPGATGGF